VNLARKLTRPSSATKLKTHDRPSNGQKPSEISYQIAVKLNKHQASRFGRQLSRILLSYCVTLLSTLYPD
jgi:hypothetical protein